MTTFITNPSVVEFEIKQAARDTNRRVRITKADIEFFAQYEHNLRQALINGFQDPANSEYAGSLGSDSMSVILARKHANRMLH